MTAASKGLAASVQVRLVHHAKAIAIDPNVVLARYATERFLYRLSRSPYADRFILKGALLMLVWLGETIRPTRDADLLGYGDLSAESLSQLMKAVCTVQVDPDGLQYFLSSVDVSPIRPGDAYGGLRGTVQARLGNARLRVQVDVGIGDAVVPTPEWLEYPSLLGFPPPRLRVYRPETAIAEKLHAMVDLGEANSRMRDFFDVYALAAQRGFAGDVLAAAVRDVRTPAYAASGNTAPCIDAGVRGPWLEAYSMARISHKKRRHLGSARFRARNPDHRRISRTRDSRCASWSTTQHGLAAWRSVAARGHCD